MNLGVVKAAVNRGQHEVRYAAYSMSSLNTWPNNRLEFLRICSLSLKDIKGFRAQAFDVLQHAYDPCDRLYI